MNKENLASRKIGKWKIEEKSYFVGKKKLSNGDL